MENHNSILEFTVCNDEILMRTLSSVKLGDL